MEQPGLKKEIAIIRTTDLVSNVPVSNSGKEKVLFGVRPTFRKMTNLNMNSRAAPDSSEIAPILRARRRVLNSDDDSMPPYDPNGARPSIGNKRPRGHPPSGDFIFIDDEARDDGDEEEEEEEVGEELSEGFIVPDGHLSEGEGSDGNQLAM